MQNDDGGLVLALMVLVWAEKTWLLTGQLKEGLGGADMQVTLDGTADLMRSLAERLPTALGYSLTNQWQSPSRRGEVRWIPAHVPLFTLGEPRLMSTMGDLSPGRHEPCFPMLRPVHPLARDLSQLAATHRSSLYPHYLTYDLVLDHL